MIDRDEGKQETTPTCAHHWAIEAADGPTSEGVCKNCHQTRTFQNFVAQPVWGNQSLFSNPGNNIPTSLHDDGDEGLEDLVA